MATYPNLTVQSQGPDEPIFIISGDKAENTRFVCKMSNELPREEVMRLAVLIAAAPELLEACKALVAAIEHVGDKKLSESHRYQQALDAIEKAS